MGRPGGRLKRLWRAVNDLKCETGRQAQAGQIGILVRYRWTGLDLDGAVAIVRASFRGATGGIAPVVRKLLDLLAMYAIIKTGGKQYRVASGDLLRVEKLDGDAGDTVEFDQVLMLGDGASVTIGVPLVAGAHVMAEIVTQARDPKILIFKKKRRHKYRRKNGHRQLQTVLRVTGIKAA